jgi:hypothetical protein
MSKLATYGGIAAMLLASQTAHANDEVRFKIDEYGWELMQADGKCTARAFLEGPTGQGVLELQKRSPRDTFQAVLAGPGLSKPANVQGRLEDWVPTSRLALDEAPLPVSAVGWLEGTSRNTGATFSLSTSRISFQELNALKMFPVDLNVPESSAEVQQTRSQRFASVTGIYLDNLFREPVAVETGALTSMMELMDACTDKIVESWGISPTTEGSLSRRARPLDYIRMVDELTKAFPNWHQRPGTAELVTFRVMLDARGYVTDCITYSDSGADARLTRVTCDVLKNKVRYEPALDAESTPVASYYTNSIVYAVGAGQRWSQYPLIPTESSRKPQVQTQ